VRKYLFFGLGNPGSDFAGTRHNLGWAALKYWADHADEQSLGTVHLLWPVTGMNDSGRALNDFLRNKEIAPENMVVLHDDLELPLGQVKLVEGGSAKGHNGVRSIQSELDSQDFKRVRLGIGRPEGEMTVHDFVLGKFTGEELLRLEKIYLETSRLLGVLTENN